MRSDEQIAAYEGRLADLAEELARREMTAREISRWARERQILERGARATAYAWVEALRLRGVAVEHEEREVRTVTGRRLARVYRINGAIRGGA